MYVIMNTMKEMTVGKLQKTNSNRIQTYREELANWVTHAISAAAVLVLMPFVGIFMHKGGAESKDIFGVMVFLLSIFLMFLMSTLYHAAPPETDKKIFMRKLDHIFIFVAIAGSFTPLALSFIWNIPGYGKPLCIGMLCIQWLMVIGGALFKALSQNSKLSVTLPFYMIMGWIMVFIFPLFIIYGQLPLFFSILVGGLFYTLGVIAFAFKHIKYTHTLWHFFVTFGAAAHIIGICFLIN